jgi:hypothetical protein
MARGWESKSVEDQQAESLSAAPKIKQRLTPEQVIRHREKQSLQLSRNYLLQQLELAQDPRHRRMLDAALADLDAKLARLA